jgi:DNA-directed RNA polymerase specialized sigma24 family protein
MSEGVCVSGLEAVADERLAATGSLSRRSCCMSEGQLRRVSRAQWRQAPMVSPASIRGQSEQLAFDLHLDYLITFARLTPIQERYVRLRLGGLSIARIAAIVGRRRSTVFVTLKAAFRRLRKAYLAAPLAGWHEVYIADIHRR